MPVDVPVPSLGNLLWFLLGLLIGLPAPYFYASERIQGFIRAILAKILPYRPPPGVDSAEEALERANAVGDGGAAGEGDSSGDGEQES